MAMNYREAISEIMPLVIVGDTGKPFIITRDSAYGDWQVCYPDPDKADSFTISQREHDPYIAKYIGADFDAGSFPYVYDKVLCDRLRLEYYDHAANCFTNSDKERLHALINFFEDNVSSFSGSVTDYLVGIDQPFRALDKMCPFNMATAHEGWTFNENLALDAVDKIENAVAEKRIREKEARAEEEKTIKAEQKEAAMIDNTKLNLYDSTHTISYIELFGYEIELGEDTENELPFYIETSGKHGGDYSFRTDKFDQAIKVYGEQLIIAASEMRLEHEGKAASLGVEHTVLTMNETHCLPDSKNADYTGKLIIVDGKSLLPEYRTAESQLVLCSHGNGARPNAIGTSVFGIELFSGDKVCHGRHQITGIADIGKLPEWAKSKLDTHETEQSKKLVAKETPEKAKPAKKPSLQEKLGEAKQKAARESGRKAAEHGGKPNKRKDMEVK